MQVYDVYDIYVYVWIFLYSLPFMVIIIYNFYNYIEF